MNNEHLLEAVFERCCADDALPAGLRLTVSQWAALFSCDGRRCLLEIAVDLGSTPARIFEAFTRLADLGLVRERQLDISEYARVAALASGAESPGSTLSLAELTRRQEALAKARSSKGSRPDSNRPPAPPTPAIPFQPLAPEGRTATFSPAPPASNATIPDLSNKTLNLGGLVRFIASRDKDPTSGQLAVYRVFMGVNTALLRDAGIHSLRFDDNITVKNPALIEAISKSVEKNLGIPIPANLLSNTDAVRNG